MITDILQAFHSSSIAIVKVNNCRLDQIVKACGCSINFGFSLDRGARTNCYHQWLKRERPNVAINTPNGVNRSERNQDGDSV